MTSHRPKVLLVGAVPPPTHGVAVVVERIMQSTRLARQFDIRHVDISDRRSLDNIGRWDWTNVWLAVNHWLRLALALVRHRPELVHIPLAQNYLGLLRDWVLLVTALAFPRTKVVGHVAGGGFGAFLLSAAPPFRWIVRSAVKRCTILIVSSEWHRERVAAALPDSNYVVVRRGTEEIEADESRVPGRELQILFANSFLTQDKGVFDALQAAELCNSEGLNARWAIVGEFVSTSDELLAKKLARELKVIELTGPLPRESLLERYKQADIFVFAPGPEEAFGLVRIEAMAAGLPVVTTVAGGADEVIDDGRDGFIVDFRRPDQIAQRVLRLAADAGLRREMGRRAQGKQRQKFNVDTFERMLASAWLEALSAKPDLLAGAEPRMR